MSTLAHDFTDDPKEAADLVNDLFTRVFFSIEDYGGDVIKLVGDALVCLWRPVFDDPEDEQGEWGGRNGRGGAKSGAKRERGSEMGAEEATFAQAHN